MSMVNESCTHIGSCNPPKLISKSSSLQTQQTSRCLPRKRSFPDEFSTFQQRDIIKTFQDLNESIAPGLQLKELDNCVSYFHLVFHDEIKFPKILEFLKVDDDLHVQLQYNGMPLPQWSVQGHNVTLKKVTYLENFPAYIRNTATDNYNELLNELNQRNFY